MEEELMLGRIELIKIMVSHITPVMLSAAVRLGIPEIIANQGENATLSAEQILSFIPGASPRRADALARILKFLAHKKILNEVGDPDKGEAPRYGLNGVSRWLVPETKICFSAAYLSYHTHEMNLAWQQMHKVLFQEDDDATAFKLANGDSFFQFVGKFPEVSQAFNDAMIGFSSFTMPTIIKHYSGFNDTKRLVDVGGNLGISVAAVVEAHPGIQGVNFDLPHVIAVAPEFPGVTNVSGDMFQSIPEADTIMMKTVLHDWDDEKCELILKNCYNALPKNGRLVVIEYMYSEDSCFVPEMDMSMLATVGGRERSKKEWTSLLSNAGFSCIHFIKDIPGILEVVIQANKN